MDAHEIGRIGEDCACELLESLGYRIVSRNTVVAGVEIDVIAYDTDDDPPTLAFCEVKTRSSTAFGLPAEAVTETQQRRLRRGAGAWLSRHGRGAGVEGCRFDVVEVLVRDRDVVGRVLRDAF
ncbi:MAG: YraN family protein [Acidimicrobiia bacterium]|nr:YraN family protein [Acidimicrobiia bacterium]